MKTEDDMSKIDAAIAAAKQRKAGRAASEGNPDSGKAVTEATKKEKVEMTPEEKEAKEAEKAAAKAKKDAERAAKKQEKQAARDAKKAERDEKRAAKKATKEAEKAQRKPHTSKLDKARAKLPELTNAASNFLTDIVNRELSSVELIALAQHIDFEARSRQTVKALTAKLEAGQVVRITGGKDTRAIGKLGTLSKVQRIRCYVEVPGIKRPVYLFTSDVASVTDEEAQGINAQAPEAEAAAA